MEGIMAIQQCGAKSGDQQCNRDMYHSGNHVFVDYTEVSLLKRLVDAVEHIKEYGIKVHVR